MISHFPNRARVLISAVLISSSFCVSHVRAQFVDDPYENIRRQQEKQRRNDELAAQQPPPGCPEGSRDIGIGGCLFPSPPAYGAIASHLDASDVWVTGMYPNQGAAMNAALNACNRVMGGGCEAGWTVNRGTAVVGRGANGRVLWAIDRTRAEAQRRLDELCRRDVLGCTSLGTFNGRSEFRGRMKYQTDDNVRQPRDLTNIRMLYAASASLSGSDFDRRVWVASGFASAEEAQAAAVQACQQAATAGKICQRTVAVGNGVMISYLQTEASGARFDSFLVEQNEARGRQAVAAKCRQEKVTCTVTAVDDSRVRAVKLHNFAQPGS